MTEIKVQYDDGLCAVEGCENRGQPQICPYDGSYHRHGKVHYENNHPRHPDVKFKAGAWRGICKYHFDGIEPRVRAR